MADSDRESPSPMAEDEALSPASPDDHDRIPSDEIDLDIGQDEQQSDPEESKPKAKEEKGLFDSDEEDEDFHPAKETKDTTPPIDLLAESDASAAASAEQASDPAVLVRLVLTFLFFGLISQ